MLLEICFINCLFNTIENPTLEPIFTDAECKNMSRKLKKKLSNLVDNYTQFSQNFYQTSYDVIKKESDTSDEIEEYVLGVMIKFTRYIEEIIAFVEKNEWSKKKVGKLESGNDFLNNVEVMIEMFASSLKKPLDEMSRHINISKYDLKYKNRDDRVAIIRTLQYIKEMFRKEEEMMAERNAEKKEEL